MKHSQSDNKTSEASSENKRPERPRTLPRPLYGSVDQHPNIVRTRPHHHRWAQLSYAIQGHLQVWTPKAHFIALPHRAVWIPARAQHQVRQSPQAVIRSLYLDSDALGLDWPDFRVLAVSSLLHELIREFALLPSAYEESGADGRLAHVLVDQLAKAPEVGLVLPWPTDPRLGTICRQLQNDPAADMDLKTLSTQLGVSTRTLTRIFQRQTGLGFRLWRQRARLVHALPLLERGDRITDVALACGYDSLSSFIATFREYTGSTPGIFAVHAGAGSVQALTSACSPSTW
ncbi:MAG: helix-turn-helix transcriptional regulator [Castellaniella sp.]|uniref:AraC family transcriptional regulator n=1 Tax=Castellaniella sp. TaxID=1955812 RepID=UPI003C7173C5